MENLKETLANKVTQSNFTNAKKHKDYSFLCGEPLTFKHVGGTKKIK